MGQDPLEADRQFRRVIEDEVKTGRQSRWQRRLLTTLVAPFIWRPALTLLLVILICVAGFVVFLSGVAIKWTDAYACALAEARRNPDVIAELGEPIDAGFFAWSFGYSQQGSVTDTSFHTTLTGPNGEGTLMVQWYRAPVGSSLRMALEKDAQMRVVYGGAIPCR